MTIAQARAALKARRLDKTWSFDALYADMVRVVGDERAPSPPTIRRFVLKETEPEETTTHVIAEYLGKVGAEERAVA